MSFVFDVTIFLAAANNSSYAVEQRLVRHLLRNYDTDARGVSNVSRTVRVEIELMLLRIQHLVRKLQYYNEFLSPINSFLLMIMRRESKCVSLYR